MSDITTRLRTWTHAANAAPASDLMDEAAAEIERLRLELYMRPTPNILVQSEVATMRLTGAEREAIREAVRGYKFWAEDHVTFDQPDVQAVLYRLNGLLERSQ